MRRYADFSDDADLNGSRGLIAYCRLPGIDGFALCLSFHCNKLNDQLK
jgi:hypothetical protein